LSRATIAQARAHEVPQWWRDAKLGIFVHWTPASIPAYAPVDGDIGDLIRRRDKAAMAYSPYAEWYQNSLQFPHSPVAAFHAATYPGRTYESFAADWERGLEQWDPAAWAASFAATGARYVVLVAKHHDGYCLWPTDVANPNRSGFFSRRDVVGELAAAVRAAGLRFGLYYCGGLDWTFNDRPIGTFADLIAAQPRGSYPAYAAAQTRELIDRYQPSVLWNDISWPQNVHQLAALANDYYAAVPDGVINDRFMPWSPLWGVLSTKPARWLVDRAAARQADRASGFIPPRPPIFDVRTPEYAVFDHVQRTPWECVRGMDHSFGYNQLSVEKDFITKDDLLWTLVDITAKGGNLRLNVGPRGADAQIPDPQRERLGWLGAFTSRNGEALFGTTPWVLSAPAAGDDVRYTTNGAIVFAHVQGTAAGSPDRSVTLGGVTGGSQVTARVVGPVSPPCRVEVGATGVTVHWSEPAGTESGAPTALALTGVTNAS
jgi:alpha-L-fucosidase